MLQSVRSLLVMPLAWLAPLPPHMHAAPDSFELERAGNAWKNHRRQLTELEEKRVAQGDVAGSAMAATAALAVSLLIMFLTAPAA